MRSLLAPSRIIAVALCGAASFVARADGPAVPPPTLQPPPQDQGLPYTRSGRDKALRAIQNGVAVFANAEYGSRYGYVRGLKVRLDDAHVLKGEAVVHDGEVYVPEGFVGILALKEVNPQPAPEYLAKKWVYTIPHEAVKLPDSVRRLEVKGMPYVAFADAAKVLGLKVFKDPRGLAVASAQDFAISDREEGLMDNIVTLFDTPDKLADPDIATSIVPMLKAQGKWTDHVATTPEQLKLLDGPETEWSMTPHSDYDYTGFNAALLGSKVPAPGVYPRLLFSETDIPMLLKRLQSNRLGQKTLAEWEVLFTQDWWNPATSDGQVFLKLASDTEYHSLQWPKVDVSPGAGVTRSLFDGQKPGIANSHVNYNTNCLTSMALYCLLTGNDDRGKQVATALANYYKLLEPFVDELNAKADSEFGLNPDAANFAETGWRGMHGTVAHMDLAFALDFAGKWMTAEQKESMRRFIAKATYGRRDNMQAAAMRVRDINHLTWHLTNYLAASAIEGLEGCDPEVLQAGRESIEAFCEWGIDKYGQIFESNGKNGGGLQFQILAMNVLARRGLNLWGHPHWRKLLDAQIQCTSPNGKATVSCGTYGGGPLSTQAVDIFKAFYPGSKSADWLLSQNAPLDLATFDVAAYRQKLEKGQVPRIRLPGPTYCGFTFSGLYDTDWASVTRADTGLPLTFDDDVHGIIAGFSDATPEASWLCMQVRANQYIGSGHHHADVGMFYFSGLGVNWITESPFPQSYDGKFHNEVLIDGISEPDGIPARGSYLGASVSPAAAFASADMTRSYSWRWMNQLIAWDGDAKSEVSGNGVGWWHPTPRKWSLETEDLLPIAVYKGTQHYKSRPWWPTYNFSNWLPVLRTPYNPVQYACRTAGLVRGSLPYGIVLDDVKKDDELHLYQWAAMAGSGVTALPQGAGDSLVLARSSDTLNGKPANGAPLLLVRCFDSHGPVNVTFETATDGPPDRKTGKAQAYNRIVAAQTAKEVHLTTVLFPFRQGDEMPTITCDAAGQKITISAGGQKDEMAVGTFSKRTRKITIRRNGELLLETK